MLNEYEIRTLIHADLPPHVFVNRPLRALLVLPLAGAIVSGSLALLLFPLPCYVAVLGSLLIGNCYGSLMFLGHEIGHGATVRSRRIQDALLYLSCWIFCFSPHLWRIWHHQAHHPHTNMAGRDPDSFGTLVAFETWDTPERLLIRLVPGSGHWLSPLFLCCFFTLHGQLVLWKHSRVLPGFVRLHRWRATADSLLMALFWVATALLTGPRGTIYVVALPMVTANAVVMSYIATNHMLRPLTQTLDTLGTTMSVRSHPFLDLLHFNFSHHVEHHLFPAMCSSYYPLVRERLRQYAGERYLAPSHWWALRVLFRTPRLYDGTHVLVEPYSGQRVTMREVDELLME